jgi:hypothetical protein
MFLENINENVSNNIIDKNLFPSPVCKDETKVKNVSNDIKPHLHQNDIAKNVDTNMFNKSYKHEMKCWKQFNLFPTFNFGLDVRIVTFVVILLK